MSSVPLRYAIGLSQSLKYRRQRFIPSQRHGPFSVPRHGQHVAVTGWTTALTQAVIVGLGTADSFLKVSHPTKARHVRVVALAKLQQESFVRFLKTPEPKSHGGMI